VHQARRVRGSPCDFDRRNGGGLYRPSLARGEEQAWRSRCSPVLISEGAHCRPFAPLRCAGLIRWHIYTTMTRSSSSSTLRRGLSPSRQENAGPSSAVCELWISAELRRSLRPPARQPKSVAELAAGNGPCRAERVADPQAARRRSSLPPRFESSMDGLSIRSARPITCKAKCSVRQKGGGGSRRHSSSLPSIQLRLIIRSVDRSYRRIAG
jgi:hypothetical protein